MSETPAFDPRRTWAAVEARLEAEADPARCALLGPASPDGRLVGEDIYFGSPPMARLRRME